MQDLEIRPARQPRHHLVHSGVEAGRALTSPDRQNRPPRGIQPEGTKPVAPRRRVNLRADRKTGDEGPAPGDARRRVVRRHRDGAGEPREEGVRAAGRGVALEQHDGDAHDPRREDRRRRGDAPGRDDGVGPEPGDDRGGLQESGGRGPQRHRRAQRRAAARRPHYEAGKRDAGGRDERRLHARRAADEQHPRGGIAAAQRAGERQRGIDVAARAAAGEHEVHPRAQAECRRTIARRDCEVTTTSSSGRAYWETFRRMPTAMSFSTSDDPPKLMNGSGTPVIGSDPETTPMLRTAWPTSIVVSPETRSAPYRSGQRAAIRYPQTASAANSRITTMLPMRPSSSPMMAKMKSVWRSGR